MKWTGMRARRRLSSKSALAELNQRADEVAAAAAAEIKAERMMELLFSIRCVCVCVCVCVRACVCSRGQI